MGGRGASSGTYRLNGRTNSYGDEFESVLPQLGDTKFVMLRDRRSPTRAPSESMTPWRIYATMNAKTGQLHSVAFMGADGKRYKQIELRPHKRLAEHVHDEGPGGRGRARKLSRHERRQLAAVRAHVLSEGRSTTWRS